jgi:hypothetical protein
VVQELPLEMEQMLVLSPDLPINAQQKLILQLIWEKTPLSESFFSQKNAVIIQNEIKRQVYEKSHPKGYIIDDQSTDELKIIMRAMYYQYARNLPNDIQGQIADLNRRVANWSVPHILSAVDHYMYYLKDIDTLPVPLARPVHLSRSGSKTLPFNTFM